jgi:hypothetical protein
MADKGSQGDQAMPAFNCPECHALMLADYEATYYWCECGQPLTAANAAPGMARGVADEIPSGPAPTTAADRAVKDTPALPELEAPEVGTAPTEAVTEKQRA